MAEQQENTLDPAFTEWLKQRTASAKENHDNLLKTGGRDWYRVKDPSLKSLREAYAASLNNGDNVTAGQIVSLRLQTAQLESCARANRLRHCTVPHLLAYGNTDNRAEVNGALANDTTQRIAAFTENAKAAREAVS